MEIKRVCVAGMGTMGSQIGIVCARAGFETILVESSGEHVEAGMKRVQGFLDAQIKKGKMAPDVKETLLSRITATASLAEGVSQTDLVIEAVFEEIETKKKVFQAVDRAAPGTTIIASNTSTLWIAELAAATRRPDRCLGTHFLIPAALTPLVEVVRGPETSEETYDAIIGFLKQCGKETVTVADSPGFVINRLYLPMVNEAFFALETGLARAEEIDKACSLGLGFPLGPLAAADAFGLDILLACMNTFHRELGDKYRPAPLLVKLVKAGHLGRKTGRGVYHYN
jgi:3-hydroxybutyryl-CoA dehydrogenase